METEVWKHFEENIITHSAAHYLMAIKQLLEKKGYSRVTDVARQLHVSRGSCSVSLKTLKKRGYVLEDENKFLFLSHEGKRLAELIEKNDELLEIFFRDVLGVSPQQAKIDACKVEHLLSTEATIRLANFIRYIHSGEEIAQQFLQKVHRRHETCSHNTENCSICNSVCFLEQE